MSFPFEYDHGVPLVIRRRPAPPRDVRHGARRHPAGAGRSHDLVCRRHTERPARDSSGLVAHGAVGRRAAGRRALGRHLHAAGDGTAVRRAGAAHGRDPAGGRRDPATRQVPGHARRRTLDHAAARRRCRRRPSGPGRAADRRARRSARLLHGDEAQPRLCHAPVAGVRARHAGRHPQHVHRRGGSRPVARDDDLLRPLDAAGSGLDRPRRRHAARNGLHHHRCRRPRPGHHARHRHTGARRSFLV